MAFPRTGFFLIGSAFLVAGCSFTSDALWPSLSGDDTAVEAQPQAMAADDRQSLSRDGGAYAQPQLGTGSFDPIPITQGTPTGTFVGQKVVQLRGELQKLQDNIGRNNGRLQEVRVRTIEDSQRYHGTVAAINARLQVGTTKGNPILVQQFNSAQSDLEQISADLAQMNVLANAVAEDSTMSEYLLESTQAAFGLSGAVDEDHAQLAVLQDEVSKTVVLIERLLKELNDDVRRQTAYLSTERSNLNTLLAGVKSGELYGQSLTNQSFVRQTAAAGPVTTVGRRPLAVVRFDKPNVAYEQPLYSALRSVLDQRPNAVFDLVAVAPAAGGPAQVALNSGKARRHAEGVMRSLTEMGLPADRIVLSAQTSAQANVNEVHLFLR